MDFTRDITSDCVRDEPASDNERSVCANASKAEHLRGICNSGSSDQTSEGEASEETV